MTFRLSRVWLALSACSSPGVSCVGVAVLAHNGAEGISFHRNAGGETITRVEVYSAKKAVAVSTADPPVSGIVSGAPGEDPPVGWQEETAGSQERARRRRFRFGRPWRTDRKTLNSSWLRSSGRN